MRIGIGVVAFFAAPLVLAFILAIGQAIRSGSSPKQADYLPPQPSHEQKLRAIKQDEFREIRGTGKVEKSES